MLVHGRLADGVPKEDADVEMALVTARQAVDHPEVYGQRLGEVAEMTSMVAVDWGRMV